MADYLCKSCGYNNNGWCKKHKKNGLTKIKNCDDFTSKTCKKVEIIRSSKDYYGQQMITFKINSESVEMPEIVLEKFISDKEKHGCWFTVNYSE